MRSRLWLLAAAVAGCVLPCALAPCAGELASVEAQAYKPLPGWSVGEVREWMRYTLAMPDYAPLIDDHAVDGVLLEWIFAENPSSLLQYVNVSVGRISGVSAARLEWIVARPARNITPDHALYDLGSHKSGVFRAEDRAALTDRIEDLLALDRLRRRGSLPENAALRVTTPELRRLSKLTRTMNITCEVVCHHAPSFYPHVRGRGKQACAEVCEPNFGEEWTPFELDQDVGHFSASFVNDSTASTALSCSSCLAETEVASDAGSTQEANSRMDGQVACRWCPYGPASPSPGSGYCYNVMEDDRSLLAQNLCDGPVVPPEHRSLCATIGCDGVENSGRVFDLCGVCDGDGSSCADVCGVANGDNSTCIDACGVLFGDNSTCSDWCSVPWGDNATCIDACLVPNGDNTTCEDACFIPWGDNTTCEDACFIPWGDNSTCAGCDGVPWSGYVNDTCSVCAGDNSTCAGCDGVPNSGYHNDTCAVCGGWNETCSGCDGVPFSGLEWDFCHVCGGDNSSCLLHDCDGARAPKHWLGDGRCDDGSPRLLDTGAHAGWTVDSLSWWVQCLTVPYRGLVALLPFCYDTMEYLPYYECRYSNGTLSTTPNCTDGAMKRSQDGELRVSAPRDTTWSLDGTSWWEVCSITPSLGQCAEDTAHSGAFNSTVVDYRDLAVVGAPNDPVPSLGANFKCAAFEWDSTDCCPSRRTCLDCTSCGANCTWCVTPFGDGHCFDATDHAETHPLYCGALGHAMSSQQDCEAFVRVERGRIAISWFCIILPLIAAFLVKANRWRKDALIREAFDSIDKDHNESLDEREMGKMFRKLGVEMTTAQVREATHEMDRDWSGDVSLEEFSNWWHLQVNTVVPGHATRQSLFEKKKQEEQGDTQPEPAPEPDMARDADGSDDQDGDPRRGCCCRFLDRCCCCCRRCRCRRIRCCHLLCLCCWDDAWRREAGREKELTKEHARWLYQQHVGKRGGLTAVAKSTASLWLRVAFPGFRQWFHSGLNVFWALALPMFLGETLCAVWGWVGRGLCSCSPRRICCCCCCCCRKSQKKYTVDAVDKVAREELPKIRRCWHPPMWFFDALGYAGFGAMGSFAALILFEIAPDAALQRQPERIERELLIFVGALLGTNCLVLLIFGFSRHRTLRGKKPHPHVLSKSKQALVVWETVQLALLHIELKQGRQAGIVLQAMADLAHFTFINHRLLVLASFVVVAVTAAQAGLAAYTSSAALRSGLMVSPQSTKLPIGWAVHVAGITVLLKLADAFGCSLHEAPAELVPARWDGLGLSNTYTLNASPDIVCWQGQHLNRALAALIGVMFFVPACVWVELPSEQDESAQMTVYFGFRSTCKAAIVLLSLIFSNEPLVALLISLAALLCMLLAHVMVAPAGALYDDFGGNLLLLASVIVPAWSMGSCLLGLLLESEAYWLPPVLLNAASFFVVGVLFCVCRSRRIQKWRQVYKALAELRRGCAALEGAMDLRSTAGKSWDEIESQSGFDSIGAKERFSDALVHFDNAKFLHSNSIVLGWRATTLERMGLFDQSKAEAMDSLALWDSTSGMAHVGGMSRRKLMNEDYRSAADENIYAMSLIDRRLDVNIPLPTKDYLLGLVARVEYRIRAKACGDTIALAQQLFSDRALEVESPPPDREGAARVDWGDAWSPIELYKVATAAELRQLGAAHSERAVSLLRLAEGGSGGVQDKFTAWCDVQQTKELDRMLDVVCSHLPDGEWDDDSSDDATPIGNDPYEADDGWSQYTSRPLGAMRGIFDEVATNLDEMRPEIATELLYEAKIATNGLPDDSDELIARSLALCQSWRGHWMVFERARSFNQRSDALERTIQYNDMLVNRAEGSRALEEQFRSDVHREYSFDSLAAARRYREVDLLHTRALLNFAHAHPLNGVIDMDFVELARQRQARDAEAPRPPQLLPLLWNKAVMLEKGGALQDAHEAFLYIVEVTAPGRQIDGAGFTKPEALDADDDSASVSSASSASSVFSQGGGEGGDDARPRVLSHMPVQGVRSKGGGRGKIYFQQVLAGDGFRVRPRTARLDRFDYHTLAKESVLRVEAARAELARKKHKIQSGWETNPGAPLKTPKWALEAKERDALSEEQKLLRGAPPIRPPSGDNASGAVRRSTGLRMTLPVLAAQIE